MLRWLVVLTILSNAKNNRCPKNELKEQKGPEGTPLPMAANKALEYIYISMGSRNTSEQD